MDRILSIVGWVIVAVTGLVLWTILPEVRTTIACLLSATLIFYVFSAAVKQTVGRIVGDQLMELRCEVNAIAERVEHIDRKLAQRQAASLRDAARVAPRQTFATHRRSA
jgi:cytochrome b subunit of formate dehydrogenase